MQKFQELLTEAALLKQQKLKQQRKTYQSLPQFLKAGIGYSKRYQFLRQQNFYVQLFAAEKLKVQGNSEFKQNKFEEALTKYQEGLGIFRYIISRTNENIKDQDITYKEYVPAEKQRNDWVKIMSAFYLNICSCLTKLNKKQDAIRSADEAIHIDPTAKAHYKKAQAYLQYINKDNNDIKLGFYELNEAYKISNDKSILEEMHRTRNQIQNQREKEKKWFKFMFDKQKQKNPAEDRQEEIKKQPIVNQSRKQQQSKTENKLKENMLHQKIQQRKLKQQSFQQVNKNSEMSIKQKFKQQISKSHKKDDNNLLEFISQAAKLQKQAESQNNPQKPNKTKEKLKRFVQMPSSIWKIAYEKDFMTKYGSKIYSMLHIYGYPDVAQEYRSILARSLQKVHKQLSEQQIKLLNFDEYFTWLKNHPVNSIKKYIERYDLQLKWIEQERQNQKERKREEIEKMINKQEKNNSCLYISLGIAAMIILLLIGTLAMM